MPKAKPKEPKTQRMWMEWGPSFGYYPMTYGHTKTRCKNEIFIPKNEAVLVRIVPEAEYQRMRKAATTTKEAKA